MKKKDTGIYFKCSRKEKDTIRKNAGLCGLNQGEYILKRALGFETGPVQPDVLYDLYGKLCDLCNRVDLGVSSETELRLVDLIVEIRETLMLPGKEKVQWQQPDSGRSKEG